MPKDNSGTLERLYTLIVTAARPHTEYIAFSSFINQLKRSPLLNSAPLRTTFTNLRSLFTLSTIVNPVSINAIAWLEHSPLSASQFQMVRKLVDELLEKSVPEVVALMDA
jgi:acyl-CoA oxidase